MYIFDADYLGFSNLQMIVVDMLFSGTRTISMLAIYIVLDGNNAWFYWVHGDGAFWN